MAGLSIVCYLLNVYTTKCHLFGQIKIKGIKSRYLVHSHIIQDIGLSGKSLPIKKDRTWRSFLIIANDYLAFLAMIFSATWLGTSA